MRRILLAASLLAFACPCWAQSVTLPADSFTNKAPRAVSTGAVVQTFLGGLSVSILEIQLSRGKVALIDEMDWPLVSAYSWYAGKRGSTHYAIASVPGKRNDKLLMHRVLTGAPAHLHVDHRDCNGLNNTRENIRVTSREGNMRNMRSHRDGSSVYKGVSFDRRRPKTPWKAQIKPPGKTNKFIGRFSTEAEAAHAYDAEATRLFGEFARLNFPVEVSCAG